jgi:hypothetical protein
MKKAATALALLIATGAFAIAQTTTPPPPAQQGDKQGAAVPDRTETAPTTAPKSNENPVPNKKGDGPGGTNATGSGEKEVLEEAPVRS